MKIDRSILPIFFVSVSVAYIPLRGKQKRVDKWDLSPCSRGNVFVTFTLAMPTSPFKLWGGGAKLIISSSPLKCMVCLEIFGCPTKKKE